jgi:hypothetical protein
LNVVVKVEGLEHDDAINGAHVLGMMLESCNQVVYGRGSTWVQILTWFGLVFYL